MISNVIVELIFSHLSNKCGFILAEKLRRVVIEKCKNESLSIEQKNVVILILKKLIEECEKDGHLNIKEQCLLIIKEIGT